jgi:hypothetical protein
MIKKKVLFPLILSLCHSPFLFAQNVEHNTMFSSLKHEIKEQKYEAAWNTAKSLEDEHLGDPSFDFLYGVAALANNQAEYAVFAFERVTANQPNWLDAHYLLAKSNYKIANYQAAITTSQHVVDSASASKKLKQSASELIDLSQTQLDKQSLYVSQRLSLSVGNDSNINSGTIEDNIFLPSLGQSIPLTDESKENSDNYAALSYQASGSKTLSQVSKVLFSGQGTVHKFKDETNYNRMFADIAVKYQHSFDFGRVAIGGKFTPLWLDDDFYRTRTALTAGLEKQLAQKWTLTTGLEVGQTRNKLNKGLNTDHIAANVYAHYFSGNVKHSFGVNYTDEESEVAEQNHISNKLTSISYSNLWLINNNWLARGMIAFQQKEYQGLQRFFLETRDDDMWLGLVSIQYSHSKTWSYSLNINAQDKESNTPLFSYQRSDISLTANMNF